MLAIRCLCSHSQANSAKLELVNGRDGKSAKVVLTAISDTRHGRGDVEDGESLQDCHQRSMSGPAGRGDGI